MIDIEFNDIGLKTEWVARWGIITIRFDEKSFFSSILSFISDWDYKHYIKNFSQKIVNLSTIDKIHFKCDVFHGSIVYGKRQLILFSFVLDKPAGHKVFCQPETIHYKKINKPVWNIISVYLEDDNYREVNFNGKALKFTLQINKI